MPCFSLKACRRSARGWLAMIEPSGTSLRSRTPAMIASAMTPAPTTLRVEDRNGLIGGIVRATLHLQGMLGVPAKDESESTPRYPEAAMRPTEVGAQRPRIDG